MQFITPAGPRQSLLLAEDPAVFVKTLYTLSIIAQTHPPKFLETSLDKVKEMRSKLTHGSCVTGLNSGYLSTGMWSYPDKQNGIDHFIVLQR